MVDYSTCYKKDAETTEVPDTFVISREKSVIIEKKRVPTQCSVVSYSASYSQMQMR